MKREIPIACDPNNAGSFVIKTCKGKKARDAVKDKINASYVFGMNRRSHLIYIYDKRGLQATLPFCFLLCESVNK